jgi:hypothetical protein
MKHINLYVVVDGQRKPIGTFDLVKVDKKGAVLADLSAVAEARADHALGAALDKLAQGGVDLNAVHVERIYVDTEELDADKQPIEFTDPQFKTPKAKE